MDISPRISELIEVIGDDPYEEALATITWVLIFLITEYEPMPVDVFDDWVARVRRIVVRKDGHNRLQ